METPDYALIGEADPKSGDRIEALHKSMIRNDAPVVRMKLIEAEIAKIACNTHETMRVSFANMLFSLCAEVPGADVDKITGALSYRMGQRFFKGAVPYGGPCWPRDNRALAVFMDAVGVPSLMPRTIDQSNGEHGSISATQGAVGNASRRERSACSGCPTSPVRRSLSARSASTWRAGSPPRAAASSAGIRWPWMKRARC